MIRSDKQKIIFLSFLVVSRRNVSPRKRLRCQWMNGTNECTEAKTIDHRTDLMQRIFFSLHSLHSNHRYPHPHRPIMKSSQWSTFFAFFFDHHYLVVHGVEKKWKNLILNAINLSFFDKKLSTSFLTMYIQCEIQYSIQLMQCLCVCALKVLNVSNFTQSRLANWNGRMDEPEHQNGWKRRLAYIIILLTTSSCGHSISSLCSFHRSLFCSSVFIINSDTVSGVSILLLLSI